MFTDTQIKNAKGRDKAYKLTDARGLFMLVSTTGHRSWRQKYRYGGKELLLTHGPHPEVSLAEAREERDDHGRPRTRTGISSPTRLTS